MKPIQTQNQLISSFIALAAELLEQLNTGRECELQFGGKSVLVNVQDPVLEGQEFEIEGQLYTVTRLTRRLEPGTLFEGLPVAELSPVAAPARLGGETLLL